MARTNGRNRVPPERVEEVAELSIYTYTHTYTRAEAVVDQVDVLFSEAGIDEIIRSRVCDAVNQRWLEAVGLFLKRDGNCVYEIEATISWSTYSDQADLSFSTDLPGWAGRGAPESTILGKRFAAVAVQEGLAAHFWVRFVESIQNDPTRHEHLCDKVGVCYGSRVPEWKRTPETRSLPLQDLREIGLSVRSAL